MNSRQLRWFVAMLSGGVLAWFAVRRRQELLGALPASVQERIVLPFTAFVDTEASDPAAELTTDGLTRKVGRNRRISVHGKLYGPLDNEYVGQQVDVVEAEGSLIVSLAGKQIGTFAADD